MAKMLSVPPIPGVRDLQTLMAFIMNREEYNDRLEALVTLQGEIQALMGKVGKAQDIDALLSSAMRKEAEAASLLDSTRAKAKAEATEITVAAKAEADGRKAEAEHIYQETVAKMSQLMVDREVLDAHIAEVNADLDQRLKACASKEAEVAIKQAEVEAMHEAYTAKLAKLKAATEGM